MHEDTPVDFASHFSKMKDFRVDRNKRHLLLDIITVALCATLCGADDGVEIAEFGRAKEAWFRRFLELPNGIASHDTLGRVFARLCPQQFQECFASWMQAESAVCCPAKSSPLTGRPCVVPTTGPVAVRAYAHRVVIVSEGKVVGERRSVIRVPDLAVKHAREPVKTTVLFVPALRTLVVSVWRSLAVSSRRFPPTLESVPSPALLVRNRQEGRPDWPPFAHEE